MMAVSLAFLALAAVQGAAPVAIKQPSAVSTGKPETLPPVVVTPPIIRTLPPSPRQPVMALPTLTPEEAVIRAAQAAPGGVAGAFSFRIEAAALVGPTIILNSQSDYRDQRNLSVVVAPAVLAAPRQRYGGDLPGALRGKLILVNGVARRVRIDFVTDGRPTGKYYYQTHVRVLDPRQIRILS